MPVSSYILRCPPPSQAALTATLKSWEGFEVGAASSDGLAVVACTADSRAAAEAGERLRQLPGVRDAVLVYHNFEDVVEASPPAGSAAVPQT